MNGETEANDDEGIHTYLRYYASPAERAAFAHMNPKFVIPEHSDPPYDRPTPMTPDALRRFM